MIKDLYNRLEVERMIGPIDVETDDGDEDAEVEVEDYRRVVIAVLAGTASNEKAEITIEGDVGDGEGFSEIDDDDLIGEFEDIEATNHENVQKVGLKKSYEKIKVTVDHITSFTGSYTVFACMAKKYDEPV